MLSIERATGEDVDLVRDLLSETWVDTYAPHMSRATIEQVTTHWHNRELLRSQIEKPGDYFAVAKQDCKIIGLITVIVLGPQELHLPRLYVHPEHQRKGIGTRLLQAALAEYPDAMVVRLQVEHQNPKGLSYWRKQGFVEVGTNVEQIGADRIEVVNMERRLQ
jgi:ribosomal protein S18 acetylase RimI-like enzyme